MINVYKLKKTGALLFVGLFTVIFFVVGAQFYGFWIGLGTMFAGLITSYFLANYMLKTPFSDMLEGKGIMAIDLNSTGIITAFIVNVDPPYIRGQLRGKPVVDVFDRNAVFNLKVPKKNKGPFSRNLRVAYDEGPPKPPEGAGEIWRDDQGSINFSISEDKYNKARFALQQYPVLLYNSQIGSILTKDFLSEQEKTAFAEHQVLFLNQQMQNLTGHVRDFGRYIVEFMKPGKSRFGGAKMWVTIIIVILVIILVALFAPSIINTLKGAAGPVAQTVQTGGGAMSGAVTTAKGG